MPPQKERTTTLKTKLKQLFSRRKLREIYAEWAILMPAKSHLDAEYNFPMGRYAGQGYQRRNHGGGQGE